MVVGVGGGGRAGIMLGVGGFGAGRLGIIPFMELELLFAVSTGGPLGIGGGARGFSKLPSWFCGNLGLCGGDNAEDGNAAEVVPAIGVVPPAW